MQFSCFCSQKGSRRTFLLLDIWSLHIQNFADHLIACSRVHWVLCWPQIDYAWWFLQWHKRIQSAELSYWIGYLLQMHVVVVPHPQSQLQLSVANRQPKGRFSSLRLPYPSTKRTLLDDLHNCALLNTGSVLHWTTELARLLLLSYIYDHSLGTLTSGFGRQLYLLFKDVLVNTSIAVLICALCC